MGTTSQKETDFPKADPIDPQYRMDGSGLLEDELQESTRNA